MNVKEKKKKTCYYNLNLASWTISSQKVTWLKILRYEFLQPLLPTIKIIVVGSSLLGRSRFKIHRSLHRFEVNLGHWQSTHTFQFFALFKFLPEDGRKMRWLLYCLAVSMVGRNSRHFSSSREEPRQIPLENLLPQGSLTYVFQTFRASQSFPLRRNHCLRWVMEECIN